MNAAQRRDRERRQRERAAAVSREKRLDNLAREGEDAWQRVTSLVATMKPRDYDTATGHTCTSPPGSDTGLPASERFLRST